MSRENVEVVRRCFRLWVSRDFSVLPELAHSDVILDVSRRVLNPAVYRGFNGFERFAEQVDEIWEDFRFEVEALVDAGESVVAATRLSGRGRTSGVETEMREFSVWTLRDGKVSRVSGGYRERADAFEAVGMPE